MTKEDHAFIRGFATAVASMARHQVSTRDLLRQISATETLLEQAGVAEYDLEELRPILRRT